MATAAVCVCPKSAVWIYDVGKYVFSTPPEPTWKMFFDKILQKMITPQFAETTSVHFVIDKYIEESTKSVARNGMGETNSMRTNVTGLGQEMPTTDGNFQSALSNIKKKDDDTTWEIEPTS